MTLEEKIEDFYVNGVFDIERYSKSNLLKMRQKYIEESQVAKISEVLNNRLEDEIYNQIGFYRTTSQALDKQMYVAQRFSELTPWATLEIGFALTGKNGVVTDMELPYEQTVTKSTCNGPIFHPVVKDPIGWGHSHGNFSCFFSSIDVDSFEGRDGSLESFGILNNATISFNGKEIAIQKAYNKLVAAVVNKNSSKPYFRVSAFQHKRYKADGTRLVYENTRKIFVRDTKPERCGAKTGDLSVELVDDSLAAFVDSGQLDRKMIGTDDNRMSFNDGSYLYQHYKNGREIPKYREDYATTETLIKRYPGFFIDKRVRKAPVVTEEKELDLKDRVRALEEHYGVLKKEWQEKYDTLERKYLELEKKMTKELINETEKKIDEIHAIVTGRYVQDGKRVYKWVDRFKALDDYYNTRKVGIYDRIKDIGKIFTENRYLRRKHKETIKQYLDYCI